MIIFSNSGVPSATLHPAGKRYYHTQLQIDDGVDVQFEEKKMKRIQKLNHENSTV